MTQAERKGEKVARLNALNVQMKNLWSNSQTHEYLDYHQNRLFWQKKENVCLYPKIHFGCTNHTLRTINAVSFYTLKFLVLYA